MILLVSFCLISRADGGESSSRPRVLSEEPLKSALEKAIKDWNPDASGTYDKAAFQDLIGILKDMQLEDLSNLLSSRGSYEETSALILAEEEALSVQKYIDLLSSLLEREEIDDTLLRKIVFSPYSKSSVLSLNYQNPAVRKLFSIMRNRFSADPRTEKRICRLENGMAFTEVLWRKSEGLFDSFRSFPMLDWDRKWDDIRIVGLVIIMYEIEGFINRVEAKIREEKNAGQDAEFVQFRKNVQLYRERMNDLAPVNRAEALAGSVFLFDEDSGLVDFRDSRYQDTYRALKSGRGLLFSQIMDTEDDEIRRISIDILYLTALTEEDMRTFLQLPVCGRKEVREYAGEKVRHLGKISPEISKEQIKSALEHIQKERDDLGFQSTL